VEKWRPLKKSIVINFNLVYLIIVGDSVYIRIVIRTFIWLITDLVALNVV
jgi:hypothetical protein